MPLLLVFFFKGKEALVQPVFVLQDSFLRVLLSSLSSSFRKKMVAFDLLVQGKKDEVSNKSTNSSVTPSHCSPKEHPDSSPRLAHIADDHGKSSPCSVPQFPCSGYDDANCEAEFHYIWQRHKNIKSCTRKQIHGDSVIKQHTSI